MHGEVAKVVVDVEEEKLQLMAEAELNAACEVVPDAEAGRPEPRPAQ